MPDRVRRIESALSSAPLRSFMARVVLTTSALIMTVISTASTQRSDPIALFNLSRDFTDLVRLRTAAVVRVAGRYTGVVVDGRGYVLTDIGAVPAEFTEKMRIPVDLASGRRYEARPLHRATGSRTAMLKILKGGRFRYIPAGDSDELRVGDLAMTIGNAFNQASQGGKPALTVGHVAGLWASRERTSPDARVTQIVTTAAINPGTSGGPLIDIRGALIGINDRRRGVGDMGQVMPINFIRASHRDNKEAHRILSFRGSKSSARQYANYLQRAIADCVDRATPSVISLIVERKKKEKKEKEKKKEKKAKEKGKAAEPEGKKPATPKRGEGESGPKDEEGEKKPDAKKPAEAAKPEKKRAGDGREKPVLPPKAERRDAMVRIRPRPKAGRRNAPPRPRPKAKPKPKKGRRNTPVSAVIISDDGWALTATGNLRGDIERIDAVLHDGRRVTAERFGTDRQRGVTLLKLNATGLPSLPPAPAQPEPPVGTFVMTLGNPYGEARYEGQGFMTFGILSARRQLDDAKTAYQTDAWVNQANQGGALIDLDGRLLGVTFLHRPTRFGINSGIGFAVPLWALRSSLERLKQKKDVYPGYLGVRLIPYEEEGLPGARVGKVIDLSPAAKSGLEKGDRIVSVDDVPTATAFDLLRRLAAVEEGAAVALRILRDQRTERITVVAARRR